MDWSNLYSENRETYARARPKRGQLIAEFLQQQNLDVDGEHCFLEEGAFSAKDSLFLATLYRNSSFNVMDFNEDVLKDKAGDKLSCVCADAFNLPFKPRSFDVSFHSGLIILFNNLQVEKIVTEQLVVTRQYAFIFGHNVWNLVDIITSYFKRVVLGRKIFRFRRFSSAELKRLCSGKGEILQVTYCDNMIHNFIGRNAPALLPAVRKIKLFSLPCFYNEVMVVMKP